MKDRRTQEERIEQEKGIRNFLLLIVCALFIAAGIVWIYVGIFA
jgi:hypothetical protein